MTRGSVIRQRVHFVGIGGIGVSALAHFFLKKGAKVSGSDLSRSPVTEDLRREGATIHVGPHRSENLPKKTEFVIYTAAVKPDNPELKEGKRRKIPLLSYPEALGKLTEEKWTIAVAGAHGKSTTTTLAGLLLWRAGFDPSVVVGTKVKEFGNTSFRLGRSQWLVAEADEWQAGYLGYWPHSPRILILTNIDREHLDLFPNLSAIKKSFRSLAGRVPKDGLIIANGDNPETREALKGIGRRVVCYSLREPVTRKIRLLLKVPGEHNVSNALAIWHLGRFLNIPERTIFETLSHFRGTWRRFEYKGMIQGALIFDDYAHHPSEIRATLQAAREKFKERLRSGLLWCVFQPHQYQRTLYLFKGFAAAFDAADRLLLLDIFGVPGREKTFLTKRIDARMLLGAIQHRNTVGAAWVGDMARASALLRRTLGEKDVCLVMGAGDIWKIFDLLKRAPQ